MFTIYLFVRFLKKKKHYLVSFFFFFFDQALWHEGC